jgi:hypothetical protein
LRMWILDHLKTDFTSSETPKPSPQRTQSYTKEKHRG